MQKHPNTQRLLDLMDAHGVSPSEVAELTGRSYRTVLQWRGCRHQVITDTMLEFLEMKLQLRQLQVAQ